MNSPRLALLSAVLAGAACVEPPGDSLGSETSAVVGGNAEYDAFFPWQVELGHCQGTVIAPLWVLTAAHCVETTWSGQITHTRHDPVTLSTIQQSRTSVAEYVHDMRDIPNSLNDVALVRLNAPFVVGEYLQPAHVPFEQALPGAVGTIASDRFQAPSPPPLGMFNTMHGTVPPAYQEGTFDITDPAASACSGDSGSGFVTFASDRMLATGVLTHSHHSDPSEECPAEPGAAAEVLDVGMRLPWLRTTFRAVRNPNVTISTQPATCRTAPQRVPLGGWWRRADVAEIFADMATTMGGPNSSSFAVHPSSGTRFGLPEEWMFRGGGFSPTQIRWSAGDFDGDGDQDLMAIWMDGTTITFTIRRSTGASFEMANWGTGGTWSSDSQWVPGDFDNDGRTDLMEVRKDGTAVTFRLFHANASSTFEAPTNAAVQQGTWNANAKWNVADFNADGRDDILWAEPTGTGSKLSVRLAQANGTLVPGHQLSWSGAWANDSQFLTGNFDGSGGPDVMMAWRSTVNSFDFSNLTFFRNTGTTFQAGVSWGPQTGGWPTNLRWRAGDFNADGRTDVLAVWNTGTGATLTVRRWPTNGPSGLVQEHWSLDPVVWQNSTDWCVGTFDAQ